MRTGRPRCGAAPELVVIDPPTSRRSGSAPPDWPDSFSISAVVAPTTSRRAGRCSDSASNACRRTGRPLRSSALPTNSTLSSSDSGFGSRGGPVQVDAVRNDLVLAAEPAPAGPPRGLGHGDPRVELVELSPGADQRGGVIRPRLGRVGVKRADDRRASVGAGVPAGDRRYRLVDVHHVGRELGEAAAERGHTLRKRREVRDRAVGSDPDAPPQAPYMVRQLRDAGLRAVERASERVRRVERRHHGQLVAAGGQPL